MSFHAGPGHVVTLALGIDNLPLFEELFGPALASEIEAAVASRLRRLIPHIAELRREGDRKFVLRLPDFTETEVRLLAEALQGDVAGKTFQTSQGPVALTMSAGVVMQDGALDGDASQSALHALHIATGKGAAGFHVSHDESALLEYRRRLMTSSNVAVGALESDLLTIAYQPVVRSGGGNTIAFHECLARIRSADGTLLRAADFMPAIERLGLASLIDRRMLEISFKAMKRHPMARFSINIFPQTMQDRHWLDLFETGVAADPELAERLIVEVTESAAMLDLSRTRAFMERLRDMGTSFAIDDFGAGCTSLAHLRDLRFDMVKIDASLTAGCDRDADKSFLVETVVKIAERFEMMTVAEGVQTPSEARTLQAIGIEFFQGFQFGSPSLVLEPTKTPMPGVAAQA